MKSLQMEPEPNNKTSENHPNILVSYVKKTTSQEMGYGFTKKINTYYP